MYLENELTIRRQMVQVCRLLYERRYLCATEGNLSVKLADDVLLSTATNTCKGTIRESDLILTDLQGRLLDPSALRPSTELKMHLLVYELRPDVRSVVHAHPPTAVALTVAGRDCSAAILPEIICNLGVIPVAKYATPGTDEVPESIRSLIPAHDAIVLDHHGALTYGSSPNEAFYKMEMVEQQARMLFMAELLGGAQPLSREDIRKLMEIRSIYGLTHPLPSLND